jgi:hypothetical protein
VTLLEAIKAAQDEYDEEVQGFNIHGDVPLSPLEEEADRVICEQFDAMKEAGVLTDIIDAALENCKQEHVPLDIVMVAAIAFRMGMRAQRKFDRPGERTTVNHAAPGQSSAPRTLKN